MADILPLAESFLKMSLAALSVPFSAALRQGLETCQILLLHYDWPGNIRELRNMMERLALFLSVESTPDLTPQFFAAATAGTGARVGEDSHSRLADSTTGTGEI